MYLAWHLSCVSGVASAVISLLVQVRRAGSSPGAGTEGSVQASKDHVVNVTEQIDIALDRHRGNSRAERNQVKVRGFSAGD